MLLAGLSLLVVALLINSCANTPPQNPDSLCAILKEKRRWSKALALAIRNHGGSPGAVMATIFQESSFRHDAKPPRTRVMGFIPGPRISRVYGYAQAAPTTWAAYRDATGNLRARRDNFTDAVDFVAWYHAQTHRRNRVARNNYEHLYYAYHEGHGGYQRRTYLAKAWLIQTARRVAQRAQRYEGQLRYCPLK